MRRFVVSVSLKQGSGSKLREILRDGPPFDLAETTLERHLVFLGDDEAIFLFEGEHADEEAGRLMGGHDLIGRAARGRPRSPEEVFSWERPERLEGIAFGPDPGPGDSDGGSAE